MQETQDTWDLISQLGRSPGEGNGSSLQLLPQESHGQMSLAGHSFVVIAQFQPRGCSMPSFPVLHYLPVCSNSCALTSLIAQSVENLPARQETWVWFLGQEDPLEKEMAIHSNILAWRIPWTEESGRLQSMGSRELDTTKPPLPCVLNHMMPSNNLILHHPLLLPSVFPSIRVFSNELALCLRWPNYWSCSIKSFQWIFRADFL